MEAGARDQVALLGITGREGKGAGKVAALPSSLAEAQLWQNQPQGEISGPAARCSLPPGLSWAQELTYNKAQALS